MKGAIGGLVCALVGLGIMLGMSLSVSSAQSPLYAGCSTTTPYPLNPIFQTATAYSRNMTAVPNYNASTALYIPPSGHPHGGVPTAWAGNNYPPTLSPTPSQMIYRALYGMNIRAEPSNNAVIRGSVGAGTLIQVNGEVRQNAGITWRGITGVLIGETWVLTEGWMAERMLIGSTRAVYLEVVQ